MTFRGYAFIGFVSESDTRGEGEQSVQSKCWCPLGKSVKEGLWGRAGRTRVWSFVLGGRHF